MRTFLCILFLVYSTVHAQVSKFKPETIVKYKFRCKPYINEDIIITNEMWLLSKHNVSYFLDSKMIELDHQMNALASSSKIFNDATQAQLRDLPKPQITGVIKKDLSKNLIQSNRIISKSYYFYDESIKFNWSIKHEKKEFLGYTVQKATCNFKGRNYIAWFTTQVPITDGPYKFSGLPGLILLLYDEKMEYTYEAIAISKALQKDEVFFHLFENPIKVSKDEFIALSKNASSNILASIESNPNIKMSEENKKKLLESKKKNENRKLNPIELED